MGLDHVTGGSAATSKVDLHWDMCSQPMVPLWTYGCLDVRAVMEIHQLPCSLFTAETFHCQFTQLQLLELLELQCIPVHGEVLV